MLLLCYRTTTVAVVRATIGIVIVLQLAWSSPFTIGSHRNLLLALASPFTKGIAITYWHWHRHLLDIGIYLTLASPFTIGIGIAIYYHGHATGRPAPRARDPAARATRL